MTMLPFITVCQPKEGRNQYKRCVLTPINKSFYQEMSEEQITDIFAVLNKFVLKNISVHTNA